MGGLPKSPADNDVLKAVTIYTDGACIGNPGPGGYGVVLIHGGLRKELLGGYRRTTNNRMELMAAVVGLRALKTRCAVTLFTDSQYLADAVNQGWAKRWRANSWMRTRKEKAVNADLWESLLDLCAQHDVVFKWLRGHAGDPDNERCDQLSVVASQKGNLLVDLGYEERDAPPATLL